MQTNHISYVPSYTLKRPDGHNGMPGGDTAVNGDKNITGQVKVDKYFYEQVKALAIENVKADIFEKFGVDVNVPDEKEVCWIPEDVLYRMNSDNALKEKVYEVLEEHKKGRPVRAALYPPVGKCTLIFDKNGDVDTYILEPDMEALEKEVGKSGKKYKMPFYGILPEEYEECGIMDDNELYQDYELYRAALAADLIKKRNIVG